jgi:hypothetical protein
MTIVAVGSDRLLPGFRMEFLPPSSSYVLWRMHTTSLEVLISICLNMSRHIVEKCNCTCDCRRGLDWWMNLLTTYTQDSELQAIIAPLLISTIHKSPQHPLWLHQRVPWQRLLRVKILQLHTLKSSLTHLVAPTLFTITPRHGPPKFELRSAQYHKVLFRKIDLVHYAVQIWVGYTFSG